MNKVEKLTKFVDDYLRGYINVDDEHRRYRDRFHYYAKSGKTCGYMFWSYETLISCLALDGKKLFLNKVRYSSTTSRIQNAIRKLAKEYGVEIVECASSMEAYDGWWGYWKETCKNIENDIEDNH